jgi:hypothetical protein
VVPQQFGGSDDCLCTLLGQAVDGARDVEGVLELIPGHFEEQIIAGCSDADLGEEFLRCGWRKFGRVEFLEGAEVGRDEESVHANLASIKYKQWKNSISLIQLANVINQ